MIIQVIGTADATSAVRGHCSHRKSQGRNTQTRAATGKTQRLQNIAHSSFPSSPLSNIIGDMAAIDAPNTVNAMLMIVSMASLHETILFVARAICWGRLADRPRSALAWRLRFFADRVMAIIDVAGLQLCSRS